MLALETPFASLPAASSGVSFLFYNYWKTKSMFAVRKTKGYNGFNQMVSLYADGEWTAYTLDVNPFRYCGEYFNRETGDYYRRW